MSFPKLQYQVTPMIYDSKSLQDEQNFYHQKHGAPDVLNRRITYVLGDYSKQWPLTMATVGSIGYNKGLGKTAQELNDVQYTYPVMGGLNKVCRIAKSDYSAGDKPGIGHSQFYLYFEDNWIKRFYIIQSELGVQAYVLKDLEPVGNYWRATVQLDPAEETDFCPVDQTAEGVAWTPLTTNVAESESRTTEGNSVAPGSYKNQMGFLRHGMSWAGNAANKVMKIAMSAKDASGNVKTFEAWMDWFMWQFEMEWNDIRENAFWYSRYNRKTDGTIALRDLTTGKVIPRFAGVLEQIQNKSSYTTLTHNYLTNVIGDALYGQGDAAGMNITLMTGRGGMREFHKMALAAGGQLLNGNFGDVASKFISGTGYNLALGGYFSQIYHIDGYIITVKHNPIFDSGRIAQGSPKHPESGLPLESYRMVFLDTNDVDGEPNLQYVAQKGRSFLHGVVAGLTPMPKSLKIAGGFSAEANEAAALMSTDQDKSLYTRFASCGIQILRANRCFDLTCDAGL